MLYRKCRKKEKEWGSMAFFTTDWERTNLRDGESINKNMINKIYK